MDLDNTNIPIETLFKLLEERNLLAKVIYDPNPPNVGYKMLLYMFLRYHSISKILDEYNFQHFFENYINKD